MLHACMDRYRYHGTALIHGGAVYYDRNSGSKVPRYFGTHAISGAHVLNLVLVQQLNSTGTTVHVLHVVSILTYTCIVTCTCTLRFIQYILQVHVRFIHVRFIQLYVLHVVRADTGRTVVQLQNDCKMALNLLPVPVQLLSIQYSYQYRYTYHKFSKVTT